MFFNLSRHRPAGLGSVLHISQLNPNTPFSYLFLILGSWFLGYYIRVLVWVFSAVSSEYKLLENKVDYFPLPALRTLSGT